MRIQTLLPLAALAIVAGSHPIQAESAENGETAAEYFQTIEDFRTRRVDRLQTDTGWLTIAGFAWLKEGANRLGSNPDHPVALPEGAAPEDMGVLRLELGEAVRVILEPRSGIDVAVDSVAVSGPSEIYRHGEDPKMVTVGRLTFWIIDRGGEYAVRIRDPESSYRTEFHGIDFYDIDPEHRVVGTLVHQPDSIDIPSIMGYVTTTYCPGPVRFEFENGTYDLFPMVESAEDSLFFFVFEDGTSGLETYGGGRFLYSPLLPDGTVVIDFNKAYNPPCVFTPFATCPLAPPENKLAVAIRAGEKNY